MLVARPPYDYPERLNMLITDPVIDELEAQYVALTYRASSLKLKARIFAFITAATTVGFLTLYFSIYLNLVFTSLGHLGILSLGILSIIMWVIVFKLNRMVRFAFEEKQALKNSDIFRLGDKAWCPEGLPVSSASAPTKFFIPTPAN